LTIDRRTFLAGTAGIAATAAAMSATSAAAASAAPAQAAASALPGPASSGIDHIVVVMMENRSFDHYLGWLPGANGKQAGLTYTDTNGVPHSTYHLRTYSGCGSKDPDHSYEGGRIEYDNGACDGWLKDPANDTFCIGYYTKDDLKFFGGAAPYWTACDGYFSAVMAETYPNRFFQHSAQTDRTHNSTATATMPTIWDNLAAAGVPATYYYSDTPFLALWGTKYVGISKLFPQFLAQASTGTLPAVSFVDPRFLGEDQGTSGDDHPFSDIRAGQNFLNQVYTAVTTSPAWNRTLLVINYDEWGGFFDHVAPTAGPDPRPDLGTGLRGFRTPCLVISPRSPRRTVAHNLYDHTSVLKMIEWRWSLPALTVRDAAANNLAEVLDFTNPPNLTAPHYTAPPPVTGGCTVPHPHAGEGWEQLRQLATSLGFALP
jgi:phospholipase C